MALNLASRAVITTNATCGERGPERFCKLVEHVKRRPNDTIQCGICDARSVDEDQRHPIENAIDGSQRWWQSPSINEGSDYQYVTVTLDLGQVRLFQIVNLWSAKFLKITLDIEWVDLWQLL